MNTLLPATIAVLVPAAFLLLVRRLDLYASGSIRTVLLCMLGGLAAFLGRYASIRAVGDDVGLTVRNLLITRTVSWEEIVEVRFPDGAPWVSLELTDTDELAVMAIQRADGDDAKVEARRLAELVAERRTTR